MHLLKIYLVVIGLIMSFSSPLMAQSSQEPKKQKPPQQEFKYKKSFKTVKILEDGADSNIKEEVKTNTSIKAHNKSITYKPTTASRKFGKQTKMEARPNPPRKAKTKQEMILQIEADIQKVVRSNHPKKAEMVEKLRKELEDVKRHVEK